MNRQYIIDRMREPSTWRGFALVATSFGIALKPDQMEAITFVGLFVAGVIGAATKDGKQP